MKHGDAKGFHPTMLAWIGAGIPDPHGRQDGQASSVLTFRKINETKKARSVVALSRVPR
jgi:hypothetical protein